MPVTVEALGAAMQSTSEPVCFGVKLEAGQSGNAVTMVAFIAVKMAAVNHVTLAGTLAGKA